VGRGCKKEKEKIIQKELHTHKKKVIKRVEREKVEIYGMQRKKNAKNTGE
jgi:hypothetical protein